MASAGGLGGAASSVDTQSSVSAVDSQGGLSKGQVAGIVIVSPPPASFVVEACRVEDEVMKIVGWDLINEFRTSDGSVEQPSTLR